MITWPVSVKILARNLGSKILRADSFSQYTDPLNSFPRFNHCCQVASVMSDSVRPHGLQPTRLLHPWDSPGKNTGVGCHFLLQCMKVESESEVIQSCLTLSDPMDCSPSAPPSMGFSGQQYWSGVPLPSPGLLAYELIIHPY